MNNTVYLICAIGTAALCNFVTRAFPFILFSKQDTLPDFLQYLGKYLPPCVMAILVIYCIKTVSFASISGFVPELAAIAAVVLLHVWKRNNMISIAGGTALYMFLVQVIFR